MVGTVNEQLVSSRGFGFLDAEDGHRYFFHRTSLTDVSLWESLQVGQRMTFDPMLNNPKGPRASNVAPV
jgi:cold shock CspA family protein